VDGRSAGRADARVGDQVRTAAGIVGRVRDVRGDESAVIESGAVRIIVPLDEIVDVLPPGNAPVPVSPTARPPDRPAAAAGTEVSLRGLRADEAEAILERALDAAVLDDLPYLRVIHGKGTGALRDLVQRVLKNDPRVARFGLAPANQGGSGVTVVELR
jgi:DNA mismatch repair protein MutS2